MPSKRGILKGYLYEIQPYDCVHGTFQCNQAEKDAFVNDFLESIKVIGEPGDIFDCFIDHGEERWYDRTYGLVDLDAEWAQKNLTKIKNVKRKKK